MTGDLLRMAYESMVHNRRRTALTMLGMAWGIATVVLLLAYGDGFGRAINNIFESFGAKAVGVFPGTTSMQAGGNKSGVRIRFTDEDIDRLRNVVPLVRHISREFDLDGTVAHGDRTFTLPVNGIDPPAQSIWNLSTEEGRLLNDDDNLTHARVALLSWDAKQKLFSGAPAIGESVRINGVSFQVIGVLNPRMQEGDNDINRVIFIPFVTMQVLKDTHYLNGIWLDYEGLDHDKITKAIRESMAIAHNFKADDQRAIFVFDAQRQVQQFQIITLGIKILMGFIGTLTLGIGGVGLMNIMLVSVTQRTREIGVEKALGARKRDILFQFLAEALVITAVGGILGILLSYGVSISVGRLTLYSALASHAEAGDIRLLIAPRVLGVATAILAFVGLCSGMVPAVRAANLDPIEALRYE
jgi:putative ABC transport system permease protein